VSERLEKVYGLMQGEMSVLQVEKKIKTRVKIPDGAHAARILPE
jgi:ATP-dependent Lon protease